MTKQSAIDYLVKEISAILGPIQSQPMQDLLMVDAIVKAKEMERQNIIDAHLAGCKMTAQSLNTHSMPVPRTLKIIEDIESGKTTHEDGEDYYTQTFKD